jgi:hypothetical protein
VSLEVARHNRQQRLEFPVAIGRPEALGQAKIPHCCEAMTVRHAMDFFDSIGP